MVVLAPESQLPSLILNITIARQLLKEKQRACFLCGKIGHSVQKIFFAIAMGLGLLITYVDTRPNWDDTGLSALAIFLSCGLLGVMGPARPWIWALAVGSWIPVFGIILKHNFGSLLALLIAFAGAYTGMVFRKIIARA